MMRRAFTLLEVTVACLLMLVLLATGISVLVMAERLYRAGVAESSTFYSLNTALDRMADEIAYSKTYKISYLSSPSRLSFVSALDQSGTWVTTPSGNSQSQAFIVYYQHKGRLLRRELRSLDYSQALGTSGLADACDGTGQVIARGVTDFSYSLSGTIVTLSLTVESPGERFTGKRQRYVWYDYQ